MTLNCVRKHVIDTSRFSPLPPVSVAHPLYSSPPQLFSPFINVAERNRGAGEGVDDHTQPPGLINK